MADEIKNPAPRATSKPENESVLDQQGRQDEPEDVEAHSCVSFISISMDPSVGG